MKKFYFFIILVIIILITIIFQDYEELKHLTNKDFNIDNIEAIVVLTGSKGRIGTAIKFIPFPNIKYLIISGANPLSSRKQILKKYKAYKDFFYKIIIENRSKNTLQNAFEVKKILKKRALKKVLLITSLSHIKRTKFIFKKVFYNTNIKFYFYFINERVTLKKVIKENIKYIYDYLKLFNL